MEYTNGGLLENIIFTSEIMNDNIELEQIINKYKEIFRFEEVDKVDTFKDIDIFKKHLVDKGVSLEHTLWIICDNAEIEVAKALGIAVLGYQDEEARKSMKFLKTENVLWSFDGLDDRYFEQVFRRGHDIPLFILETDRCYLRELSINDIDALFELYGKKGITDYLEPLYPYEEEKEYQVNYIKYMYHYYNYGMWLVYLKESNELIGRAGIENQNYCQEGEVEMGYVISPEYQRQGFATEICEAIIDYAISEFDVKKINCLIDSDNKPSILLAQKLGFEYVCKQITKEKPYNRYIFYK